MGFNWQKSDLWLFSIVKPIFCESAGWISTSKISQDNFKFSEYVSETYFELRTLLRSPDNSIMPGIVEINGGIDFCGEPLKIRLKTLFFLFFK